MSTSIEGMAETRLHQSNDVELRQIRCNYRRGILTLYGTVSNFHVRQIAQELIKDLEGIDIIDNQIEVSTEVMHAAT
jgi:hypothetical protein